VGTTLKEMLGRDQADEEGALELYRQIVHVADEQEDIVTAHLFRGILADEEEHHDTFSTLLEGL
jgi:bacterioferritin